MMEEREGKEGCQGLEKDGGGSRCDHKGEEESLLMRDGLVFRWGDGFHESEPR